MELFDEEMQRTMLNRLLEVFPDAMPLRGLIGEEPGRKQRFNFIYLRDHGRVALVTQNPKANRTVRITAAGIDLLRVS